MNTIQTRAAALNTPATAENAPTDTKKMSSDFMKMLVAQMQYQDPTRPVDSAQMTSQLAQISTVDGINKLNDTMNSLANSLKGNVTSQAANMIGRDVLVPGNNISLTQGKAKFGVQMPSAADAVNVSILNESGKTVKVLSLGAQAAGNLPVSWNGTDANGQSVPNGNYTFQVSATSNGKALRAVPLERVGVSGVANAADGVSLNLTNNKSILAADVQQISLDHSEKKMSFAIGLSGLNAAAANLRVIGDNIANSDTKGFKQSYLDIQNVVSNTRGSSANGVNGTASGADATQKRQDFRKVRLPRRLMHWILPSKGMVFLKCKTP
jgi:flagellar basal-body rod modification protein FlgD